jgi:BirA family transcriptional regulator, biotin operon repressor / biotin---[acetyl-CoA-carboxylase] ligase
MRDEIARLAAGTIFGDAAKVHVFETIGSTNAVAVEAAAAGAPEGSIFFADEQTAGRGRGGHSWHSARGTGVYVSVLLRPRLAPADVLWLSLIAGLAVHDAIRRISAMDADLRWPNDIMLGAKKMGGILSEATTDPQRIRHAVIGIGVNVNQPVFPLELRPSATSLFIETGREWPRMEIIGALLESLDKDYRAVQEGGRARAAMLERFAQASTYIQGARVHVNEHGAGEFEGTTAGLDEHGFLRVQTSTGMRTVVSGGVRKI